MASPKMIPFFMFILNLSFCSNLSLIWFMLFVSLSCICMLCVLYLKLLCTFWISLVYDLTKLFYDGISQVTRNDDLLAFPIDTTLIPHKTSTYLTRSLYHMISLNMFCSTQKYIVVTIPTRKYVLSSLGYLYTICLGLSPYVYCLPWVSKPKNCLNYVTGKLKRHSLPARVGQYSFSIK